MGFPTTVDTTPSGFSTSAFVAKFDTTKSNAASLIYSRAFGSYNTSAHQVAVDSLGNAYVGGFTGGAGFPVTPDAVQSTLRAPFNGFVTILTPDAANFLYSTYFGSSDAIGTTLDGLGLDSSNNLYVVGVTYGIDLPTTQQLFQPTLKGTSDLFIAKFSALSAPNISTLSTTFGMAGTPVTITGINFGTTPGTSTVKFNGITATTTVWGATSITTSVPNGATSGNVVVTVGGIASNGIAFMVPSAPTPIVLAQHVSKDAGTATSSTLAFNSNNVAGNWIGICVRAGATNENFTVTDSNGNVYHQAFAINETGNGNTLAIFYAENIASGANIVAVSDTASAALQFAILEYSGIATSASLDATASAIGNSASPSSGNATTSNNGDLLLGASMSANAATFTAGSGYTVEEFVPAGPNTKLIAEDEILSLAGTASAAATLSATNFWAAGLASFKPSTGGVGTAPRITALSPTTGTNGTVVTITGYNFGTTKG